MADERCEVRTVGYLRWRILARIRRFFRPTFRRPLPRRRATMKLLRPIQGFTQHARPKAHRHYRKARRGGKTFIGVPAPEGTPVHCESAGHRYDSPWRCFHDPAPCRIALRTLRGG